MNEVIKVMTIILSTNANGFEVEEEKAKELFATVESSDYNDFYGSSKESIRAVISFVVRWEDFMETRYTVDKKHFFPKYVEYDGAKYELVRWRHKGQHEARLICG